MWGTYAHCTCAHAYPFSVCQERLDALRWTLLGGYRDPLNAPRRIFVFVDPLAMRLAQGMKISARAQVRLHILLEHIYSPSLVHRSKVVLLVAYV